MLARFHRSRVCGNRPRTALTISTSREVNEARGRHTCSRPCAFEEGKKTQKSKKTKKSRRTQNTPRNPQLLSPATATNSRRRATKHAPRVSPYSHASIDPGFVEIGFVQLSQSVKTTRPKDTCMYHPACLPAGSWAEIARRHSLQI